MGWLERFVAESNRIEGILRDPTQAEIDATRAFLDLPVLAVEDLCRLVGVYQPNAVFRDKAGVPGVRVGTHIARASGPGVRSALEDILETANGAPSNVCDPSPFGVHRRYETLHPFTDGNGRSGRALWLWMMLWSNRAEQARQLGFLHTWYYQSLEANR